MKKNIVLDKEGIRRCLIRLSQEIIEKNRGAEDLILVGIRTRGVPLSQRIGKMIEKAENIKIPLGALDITFYRDDIGKRVFSPTVQKTEIPINITGKNVVLIDEVIYTGRTIRCALDALMDLGRPKTIQLAVLIDRGHRELPISPNFVGKNIPTSHFEETRVSLEEIDGEDKVEIVKLEKPYREKWIEYIEGI